jgi:hypothetical protein
MAMRRFAHGSVWWGMPCGMAELIAKCVCQGGVRQGGIIDNQLLVQNENCKSTKSCAFLLMVSM